MVLAECTANAELLAYLRSSAQPATGRRWADLDGFELHTHPDLIARLVSWRVRPGLCRVLRGGRDRGQRGGGSGGHGYGHAAASPAGSARGRAVRAVGRADVRQWLVCGVGLARPSTHAG